jgi:copper chaperone CopZ
MLTTFKLQGLHCPACKKITDKRISSITGVTSVDVDPTTGVAKVISDKNIDKSEITKSLAGTPYSL